MTTIITYNISCDICKELCTREYSEEAALAKALQYGGVRRQDAQGNVIDECFRCVQRQSVRHYKCSCRHCVNGKSCGRSITIVRLPAEYTMVFHDTDPRRGDRRETLSARSLADSIAEIEEASPYVGVASTYMLGDTIRYCAILLSYADFSDLQKWVAEAQP